MIYIPNNLYSAKGYQAPQFFCTQGLETVVNSAEFQTTVSNLLMTGLNNAIPHSSAPHAEIVPTEATTTNHVAFSSAITSSQRQPPHQQIHHHVPQPSSNYVPSGPIPVSFNQYPAVRHEGVASSYEHRGYEEEYSQLDMPPARRRRLMPSYPQESHFASSGDGMMSGNPDFDPNLLAQLDRDQFAPALGLSAPATPTHNSYNNYAFLNQAPLQAPTPTNNTFMDAFPRQIPDFGSAQPHEHQNQAHHRRRYSQAPEEDEHQWD
eukprot:TRINITY_DN46036_c0_g1_i2.p1 TRINITY_DN46036_c0_g1~~TRINITY_DN46036_c0_g1_i2.p1  ORF type:complete len:264 (-),score=53.79 TRINITY_DN46036_c0_g1_i2:203-994(-)